MIVAPFQCGAVPRHVVRDGKLKKDGSLFLERLTTWAKMPGHEVAMVLLAVTLPRDLRSFRTFFDPKTRSTFKKHRKSNCSSWAAARKRNGFAVHICSRARDDCVFLGRDSRKSRTLLRSLMGEQGACARAGEHIPGFSWCIPALPESKPN